MLLDISQPVRPETSHFPGDVPFSCGWTGRLDEGNPVNIGWVKTSPHVGTHVDAPYHYEESGRRLGELPLDAFIGPALVVDARGHSALTPELVRGLDLRASPRVLFRTKERNDWTRFDPDFAIPTPELVDLLAQNGVRLVGSDAPSFDEATSKDLPIHHQLGRAGIVNVENLLLDDAAAGRYELLAAPVRWADMDAAPLRAVLRR